MNFVARGCMYCEGECNKECLTKEPTMITDWLDEHGDPEITKKVERELELREAAENAFDIFQNENPIVPHKHIDPFKLGFMNGAKWQQEQDRFKTVYEETPPIDIELLVQSPEGINHLASWRSAYNIFTCQDKSESSLSWKWKTI